MTLSALCRCLEGNVVELHCEACSVDALSLSALCRCLEGNVVELHCEACSVDALSVSWT